MCTSFKTLKAHVFNVDIIKLKQSDILLIKIVCLPIYSKM